MGKRFTGVVIRATGSWYEVLHDGEAVRCRIRGRLRLKGIRSTNPVVVGDQVTCESDDGGRLRHLRHLSPPQLCDPSGFEPFEGVPYHRRKHRPGIAAGDIAGPGNSHGVRRPLPGDLRGLQGARNDRTFESRPAGSVSHGGIPRRIRRCRIPRAGGFGHGRCRRRSGLRTGSKAA